MKTRSTRYAGILLAVVWMAVLLASCARSEPPPVFATAAPTDLPARTATRGPSATPPPSSTPIPTRTTTATPTTVPTPLGGELGGMILVRADLLPTGFSNDIPLIRRTALDRFAPISRVLEGSWVQAIAPDGQTMLVGMSNAVVLYERSDFTGPLAFDVYAVSLVDGLITNLSDAVGFNNYPSWSPDSQEIVYTAARGRVSNIIRVGIDGENAAQLTRDGISSLPVWSPDGRWIAFIKKHSDLRSNLYRMAPDGSDVLALTSQTAEDGWMAGLAWSPDSKYLALARATFGPNSMGFPSGGSMLLVDAATGEVSEIDGEVSREPAWSADGQKLAFVRGESCVPCRNALVVWDRQTGQKTTLRSFTDQSIEQLRWSPDGRVLGLTVWQVIDGKSRYSVHLLDGSTGEKIESWPNSRAMFWLPKPIQASAAPADCPAGPSRLAEGMQVVLSPDRPSNPLRAFPGRSAYQLGEIQQGTVLTLQTRACAPERIYWLVTLPGGEQGWTAEGDGAVSWLVPYSGQTLSPSPVPSPTSGAGGCANDADFMGDVTIPDYTQVPAGQPFIKKWRIKNTGGCTWDGQYTWRLISGDAFGADASIAIQKEVPPGGLLEISVMFTAPSAPGTYKNAWQLHDPSGLAFGTKPFLIFVVP